MSESLPPGAGEPAPVRPLRRATPAAVGPYAVKLAAFEGPLDLLLHLIRQAEVDIHDIPIASIAEQYVEYLSLLRELNLDVAGDYLVMAATLAWIKSRMLLPPSGEEEDEELDPRADLVARLLEYQRFKEAAGALGERPRLGRDLFSAHGVGPDPTPEGEREVSVDLLQLVDAFRRVLRRASAEAHVHEVETETVTVRECMVSVLDRLRGSAVLQFADLFEAPGGRAPSRSRLVATFLALLELARLQTVHLYQTLGADGAPEGPIQVRLTPGEDGSRFRERIAEIM